MENDTEFFKFAGACAGFLALAWNVFTYITSRKGNLEVNLGWGNNEDLSTHLFIEVINKGTDARTIKHVSLVYLDEKQTKNSRNSTDKYITVLPRLKLLRGEMGIEKIQYRDDPYLKELFLTRKILFRVTDTMDRNYDSTPLNDGVFSLPEKNTK